MQIRVLYGPFVGCRTKMKNKRKHKILCKSNIYRENSVCFPLLNIKWIVRHIQSKVRNLDSLHLHITIIYFSIFLETETKTTIHTGYNDPLICFVVAKRPQVSVAHSYLWAVALAGGSKLQGHRPGLNDEFCYACGVDARVDVSFYKLITEASFEGAGPGGIDPGPVAFRRLTDAVLDGADIAYTSVA